MEEIKDDFKKAQEINQTINIHLQKTDYLSKFDLMHLLGGVHMQTVKRRIKEFEKHIADGKYPKMSVIQDGSRVLLVATKPFLHFLLYRKWYGSLQEKSIPPYEKSFFSEVC